ncbi:ABC transporter ATP-binding protein [Acutalibacter muris]|uniref:ABC transporter ATP-binding protein n=1 Tax=Acutalibacter muris TaxID=1796620 RepID=A0A1Z2XLU4_9FIRM|nr:ABC transporter ATP-binding protein [Acutalibacter muris]ANU53913.1 multidrug ABC transporter permease [Hungateiclostridiaceae bacterium KB18]ASB39407.1 ABC transporter ATP-binding protein [Acutalibacter muris]QQR28697.1 ABC transporter ATP-binding protein [Acutalibacter muris]
MNDNKNQESWLHTLFNFVAPCKGKMLLSILCSLISVAGSFIPYFCLYQIISMFLFGTPSMETLIFWCGVGLCGYVTQIVFFGISTAVSHDLSYHILYGLRLKIADRLMRAPLGNVTGNAIGHLKSIMLDKVEGVERPLAHMIPELGGNLVLVILIFGYLLSIDWRMALASMATLPFAAAPMMASMKAFNTKYTEYMKANDHVNSVIIEYVEGIEVVKTFNQSTSSYAKFANAVNSFKDYTLDWFQSSWKSMNLIFSILPTTFLGTLPIGVILYKIGAITPVELTICLVLALSLLPPLIKTTAFITEIKAMQYSVEGSKELLDMDVLPDKKEKVSPRKYDITFHDVAFSYTGNNSDNVLEHLNLEMPEGTFTALVGPSGGGKSTVAKLIARFWDVSSGKIAISGTDIKDIPIKQLADFVSFVTQDNFLFNCSLMENIRLGNPKATDEEVYAAARAACCDEFIRGLEKGYNTPAGEAGKSLSGGEKQRISIARAILKNAPIIILDEATAFTDPQNEDKIQKSIAALTKGKTLLVIAHRLSTIQNADNIIILRKGQIIDSGTQGYLLENCPLYRSMWEAHIGAKNWAVSQVQKGGR